MELHVGGLLVENLESRPRQVLQWLLRHPSEVVTKATLLNALWSAQADEQSLANAVSKLRKALAVESAHIVTVHGHGYKLDCTVERLVVGKAAVSRLALRTGMSVPRREHFILENQLGPSYGSEVWVARNARTREIRVYKFGLGEEQPNSLKREVTLWRVLRETLGERPDLATLLDWNFETPPFFVEYRHGGEDLARWAAEKDRMAALSLEERLALFLQIADAVAAAHSVGVLHKDLKPSNVLVAQRPDDTWQLRVTDFGSGRLLEQDRLEALGITRLGLTVTDSSPEESLSGTAFYIAPELLAGQPPTTQTDIFALGVILYQMAVADLRRPLVTGWENDISDALLREDIETATNGNPARRLASVAELAERLRTRESRRLQRQQSEDDKKRSLLAQDRLERSRLRRPWVIAVIVSLTLGLLASLWLYQDEKRAYARAEKEKARVQNISRFNESLFAAIDPISPDAARAAANRDTLSHLARRRDEYFGTDAETKAAIDLSLGNAYFGIGDYADAEKYQHESLELFRTTVGLGDVKALTGAYRLARTLDMETKHAQARALLDATDAAAGNRLSRASSLSLLAHWTRAGNALMQMQPAVALPEAERTERIRQEIAADDLAWLIRTRSDLAWCYVRIQRNAEALQALQELMQPTYTPQRIGVMDWAKAHLQYGLALRNEGHFAEAAKVMEDTRQQVQDLLGSEHYATGLIWSHVAAAYWAAGRWEPALEAARHAYQILRQAAGDDSQATLAARGDLAALEYLTGHGDRSLPELRQVYTDLSRTVGPDNALTEDVAFYLASALIDANQPQDAWNLAAMLTPAVLAAGDAGSLWDARLGGLKGQILLAQGHQAEAAPLLEKAIQELVRNQAPAWIVTPLQDADSAPTAR